MCQNNSSNTFFITSLLPPLLLIAMKFPSFDQHPLKTIVSSKATPTPSLAGSQEDHDGFDDDDTISDDETVAMSNVSSHHHDDEASSKSSKLRMATLLSFPSSWGSAFLCGSLQVIYYVDK